VFLRFLWHGLRPLISPFEEMPTVLGYPRCMIATKFLLHDYIMRIGCGRKRYIDRF
jgi:hypothetical protein